MRRYLRPQVFGCLVLVLGTILVLAAYHRTLLVYITNTQHLTQDPLSRLTYNDDVTGEDPESRNVSSYLRCVDPEGKGPVQDTLCMVSDVSRYKTRCVG